MPSPQLAHTLLLPFSPGQSQPFSALPAKVTVSLVSRAVLFSEILSEYENLK